MQIWEALPSHPVKLLVGKVSWCDNKFFLFRGWHTSLWCFHQAEPVPCRTARFMFLFEPLISVTSVTSTLRKHKLDRGADGHGANAAGWLSTSLWKAHLVPHHWTWRGWRRGEDSLRRCLINGTLSIRFRGDSESRDWHSTEITGIVEARCRHAMTTFNGCWRTTTRKMGRRLQNHVWRSW